MVRNQPLPKLWLLSDERNDGTLARSLSALPRGSGFIYRHYHLDGPQRWARYQSLARIARSRGHCVILADSAMTAREWGADGIYGAARALYPRRADMLNLATAHDLEEIGLANRMQADAILLSPVFATRSHTGAKPLGTLRFRSLATYAQAPVIALGGMSRANAKSAGFDHWAAIDGLSQ